MGLNAEVAEWEKIRLNAEAAENAEFRRVEMVRKVARMEPFVGKKTGL